MNSESQKPTRLNFIPPTLNVKLMDLSDSQLMRETGCSVLQSDSAFMAKIQFPPS